MLAVRRDLSRKLKNFTSWSWTTSRTTKCAVRLMTIPGVGALTALAYKTFIDRPQRFAHSKAVGAAIGPDA